MLVLIVLFMERKLYLIELAIAQVCFDQRSVLRYCDILYAGHPLYNCRQCDGVDLRKKKKKKNTGRENVKTPRPNSSAR